MTRARTTADTQINTGGSVPPIVGGKNAIINGDFYWNQREFTSSTTNAVYGFDRWQQILTAGGGTVTCSAQTFTAGTAPAAPYEAVNYFRCVTSGQVNNDARAFVNQRVEDVRTLANQNVTVSFWAKAATGTPKIGMAVFQNFGSGGSSEVNVPATPTSISTTWTRYSFTVTLPSLSGKTIGTGSHLRVIITFSAGTDHQTALGAVGIQNNTFDIWGVQLEAGSVATPFSRAAGTLQGELAACQRYYYRVDSNSTSAFNFGTGVYYNGTDNYLWVTFPATMRTTASVSSTIGALQIYSNGTGRPITSITANSASRFGQMLIGATSSASVGGLGGIWQTNATTNAILEFSAEL